MSIFGVFRTIGHDLEVGAVKTWHIIELIGHDADVLFIDTLKAAQLLGFSKDQILAAVGHAEQALVMYVEGKVPGWTAQTVATLQHEFVASSLVEKSGLAPAAGQALSLIVSKLYASGSDKLTGLIASATTAAETAAGLTGVQG